MILEVNSQRTTVVISSAVATIYLWAKLAPILEVAVSTKPLTPEVTVLIKEPTNESTALEPTHIIMVK
jgi:hypothetical protein